MLLLSDSRTIAMHVRSTNIFVSSLIFLLASDIKAAHLREKEFYVEIL